jgi:hypothetical protein
MTQARELCLPAFRFDREDGRQPQLATWCARCNRVHVHDDNGGGQQLVRAVCGNHSAETYRLFPMGRISLPTVCPRMTLAETERLSGLLHWSSQLLATLESDNFWDLSMGGKQGRITKRRIRRDVPEMAFEADSVAVAIQKYIDEEKPDGWEGTPTELLAELNNRTADGIRKARSWPLTPQALGNRVDRIAPLLRGKGFTIERFRSTHRTIIIVSPKFDQHHRAPEFLSDCPLTHSPPRSPIRRETSR